jgi:predicted Zn-dependent peptidase
MPVALPTFERTVLGNGIRVVTEHIPSVRSVSVGVWVHAGSRDERPEEAGITHFIEHMVFKGTASRRGHHINRRMESVGGHLNAFTAKESTCYYARALDEHLARALDVVLDLALRPTFPERELEKEKDVVVEEMKMYEDQPEDHVYDHYEDAIYPESPLGRPVIGYEETVRGFTRQMLSDYVERMYTPDRLVVAIAGNVTHKRAVELVRKLTADLERPAGSVERPGPGPYEPKEIRVERPIQQAHLVLGTRCWGLQDDRRTVLSLLNTVLGGGMSSRLNQRIRERYGFAYSVYSFVNLLQEVGDIGVYVGTDPSKVERCEQLVRRELLALTEKPVSQQMLAGAKAQLKGSMMLGLESMSNRMMRLGKVELAFETHFTMDQVLGEVERVTAEDVRAAAEALFVPDTLTSVALLPS